MKRQVGSRRSRRAKDLAQNGAYSKAVCSMTSEMAVFTPDEEEVLAAQLLPRSDRLESVFADVPEVESPIEAPARDAMRQTLKGVRFKASSAPGPTGCRPEHLQDALNSKPRSSASLLLKALNEFYTKIVGDS